MGTDGTNLKTFSWRRVGIAVAIIVTAFYGLHIWNRSKQRAATKELTQKIEAKSFAVLSAARTSDELREAVGYLGHFFTLASGDWIAIRYDDVHTYYIPSSAVAVDSSGNWWVSYEHFCGRFKTYRHWLDKAEDAQSSEERDLYTQRAAGFPLLNKLSSAGSLEEAHATLRELGFHAVAPP